MITTARQLKALIRNMSKKKSADRFFQDSIHVLCSIL